MLLLERLMAVGELPCDAVRLSQGITDTACDRCCG